MVGWTAAIDGAVVRERDYGDVVRRRTEMAGSVRTAEAQLRARAAKIELGFLIAAARRAASKPAKTEKQRKLD